jgi:alpha/beta superfamily hydrolase
MSNRVLEINYKDFEEQKVELDNNWILKYDQIISEMGQPERYNLPGMDDINLAIDYFENSDSINCGVILVHGFTSGKTAMLKYADLFWDCGCDIVTYDHRGHGESDSAYPTGGIKEQEDLLKVTDWFKEKSGLNFNKIAWVGASWGAATSILAGAEEQEMAFILADAPYQDWYSAVFERAVRDYGNIVNLFSKPVMTMVSWRIGVDYKEASPLNAVKNVTEPVFLIHSQTDASTSSNQSVNISKYLNSHSTFIHTDWGADHCKDINVRPEEYRRLVYDFIEKNASHFSNCNLSDSNEMGIEARTNL